MAVTHIFEPIQPDPWVQQFLLAGLAVIAADAIADKIPGVKGSNRAPQVLTLLMTGIAVSTLIDVKLISSLKDRMTELVNSWASGFSAFWNIGSIVIAAILCGIFAARYMGLTLSGFGKSFDFTPEKGAERVFWDGVLFGLTLLVVMGISPWLSDAIEFLRYSLFTGLQNAFVAFLNWVGKRNIG